MFNFQYAHDLYAIDYAWLYFVPINRGFIIGFCIPFRWKSIFYNAFLSGYFYGERVFSVNFRARFTQSKKIKLRARINNVVLSKELLLTEEEIEDNNISTEKVMKILEKATSRYSQ